MTRVSLGALWATNVPKLSSALFMLAGETVFSWDDCWLKIDICRCFDELSCFAKDCIPDMPWDVV